MKFRSIVLTLALCVPALGTPGAVSAQHEPHAQAHGHALRLGTVHFPNAAAPAAQEPFQRGVALLHSFEYDEAAEAFQEAQRADPGFALAYWLEALTYSHLLWGEEDLEAAQRALGRLGATPAERLARAKTPRERAFGAAAEAFFTEAPPPARCQAYADSLRALAAADTSDLEASAFAAHAILMQGIVAPPSEQPSLAKEAGALARRVFVVNPDHPGAAHYLIHTVDLDPRDPGRALDAALAYARIAPDAEHALHMPSHIFLPLGMWPEMAASNEQSWAASRAAVAHSHRSTADLSWHSLQWLQYAYLQQGRWLEARAIVDTARTLLAGIVIPADNPDARYVVELLAFMCGAETGRWDAWPSTRRPTQDYLDDPQPSLRAKGMALSAANRAAVHALRAEGDTTQAVILARRLRTSPDSVALRGLPGTLALQLAALVARARGDDARAAELLRPLVAGPTTPSSLPPSAIPSLEVLGQTLLDMGRTTDAAAAYEQALEGRPNRSAALLGLAQARSAAGDTAGAAEAYDRLRKNWQHADPDVKRLAAAQ